MTKLGTLQLSKLTPLISFFTQEEPYPAAALKLEARCRELKIPHNFRQIDTKNSWDKNCRMKPAFILKMLLELKRAVCWIDIDAVICSFPHKLSGIKTDLGIVPYTGAFALLDGLLYFDYNERVIAFLAEWKKRCDAVPDGPAESRILGDHPILDTLLKERTELTVTELPRTYTSLIANPEAVIHVAATDSTDIRKHK